MVTYPVETNENLLEQQERTNSKTVNSKTLSNKTKVYKVGVLGVIIAFGACFTLIFILWGMKQDCTCHQGRKSQMFTKLSLNKSSLEDSDEEIGWFGKVNELASINNKTIAFKEKGIYLIIMDLDIDATLRKHVDQAIPVMACIIYSDSASDNTRTCVRERVLLSKAVSLSTFLQAEAGSLLRTTVFNKQYIYPEHNRLSILKLDADGDPLNNETG